MEEATDQVASGSASGPPAMVEGGNGGEENVDGALSQGAELGKGGREVAKAVVADAMESEAPSVAEAEAGRAKVEDDDDSILDLTSFQLHDLTDVDLPLTLAELDLTSNRLASIDPRIASLSHLQVRFATSSVSFHRVFLSALTLVFSSLRLLGGQPPCRPCGLLIL